MSCCKGKDEEQPDDGKKNRPRDHIFYQQRLPAWQPLLNARSAFPIFLIIGIIFVPLGAYLFIVSEGVHELILDYTHCSTADRKNCSEEITNPKYQRETPYTPCQCSKTFQLDSDMKGEVLMYYGLTNFYQNHRRYVKSRDDQQLIGRATTTAVEDCEPYRYSTNGSTKRIIGPCGAIANSIFNDTFRLFYKSNDGKSHEVDLLKKDIAWTSDVKMKFGVMPDSFWTTAAKPPNWPKPGNERSAGAFRSDEDLIVWMRTAALPTFRKLHRRVNHTVERFKDGLPAGNYTLGIKYSYPVTAFAGTKRVILSTTSWIGGKNATLGIAYMVVGCIHLVVAFVFIFIHIKTRKRNRSFQLDELQIRGPAMGEPQLERISSLEADQEA